LHRPSQTKPTIFVSQPALAPLLLVYQQTFYRSELGKWAISERFQLRSVEGHFPPPRIASCTRYPWPGPMERSARAEHQDPQFVNPRFFVKFQARPPKSLKVSVALTEQVLRDGQEVTVLGQDLAKSGVRPFQQCAPFVLRSGLEQCRQLGLCLAPMLPVGIVRLTSVAEKRAPGGIRDHAAATAFLH
jgi:hypothetical protein